MSKEKRIDGIRRYFITTHRTSTLRIMPFHEPARTTSHTVRVIDLSVIGAGIEANEYIERGVAWIEEGLGGHKLGSIRWCTMHGEKYRAGIHFITLTHEEEQHLLNHIRLCACNEPPARPDDVVASLLRSLQQDTRTPEQNLQ